MAKKTGKPSRAKAGGDGNSAATKPARSGKRAGSRRESSRRQSHRTHSEQEVQQLTRHLERRVAERNVRVRDLTASLVRAEQRERRRLSEIMHDELQQILYGVQLKLRLARDEVTHGRLEEAAQHLVQAETLLTRSTRVTRQLSVDLNPPILKNEGLNAILAWLQGQMKELHDLDVQIRSNGEVRIDDSDVRVLLFQVFRELLFNVAKHSGTQRATISLSEADGQVQVVVADDGKGFDAAAQQEASRDRPSVGLTSVRERVGLLGGSLDIRSNHGDGTTVTLRLPKAARIGG